MGKKLGVDELLRSIQRAASSHMVAVFDLDSTLFCVSPRTLQILQHFAKQKDFIKRYPQEVHVLQRLTILPSFYHIWETLAHLGLQNPSRQFQLDLKAFWRKHFFSNEYLVHDVPYSGAVPFVTHLHAQKAHIIYLTGRSQNMTEGTYKSLHTHGFPVGDTGVTLALKPHGGREDAEFKCDFLQKVKGSPIWFFENEPTNIHAVVAAHPHIDIVYFESIHSGRSPEPPLHIPRIRSFKMNPSI